MRAVWKYPLDVLYGGTVFDVPIPDGIVRAVGVQGRTPVMWVEVDPDAEPVTRRFRVVGTGHREIQHGSAYVGTTTIADAGLVVHVYEVIKEGPSV